MQLELNKVSAGYQGYDSVISQIDLSIDNGEFISISGKSGCGKTTLIEIIGGLHKPDNGTVLFEGQNIYDKYFDQLNFRRKLQIVFQFPEKLFFEENVRNEIAFGLKMLKISKEEIDQRSEEALYSVGLDDESIYNLSPFALSGGQKRKLALASALAVRPEILLLDEPFSGLDSEGKLQLITTLKNEHKKGVTILMVSHDPEIICEISDRLVVLNSGKIFLDGTPVNVYNSSDSCSEASIGIPDTKRTADLIGIKNLPDYTYNTFINKLQENLLRRIQ